MGCPEKGGQGCRLHPVLGRVATGVGLHIGNGGRIDAGIGVGPFQCLTIGRFSREQCIAAGAADAADDRVDPVAIAFGVIEPLQDHCRSTFTDDAAVGPLVKGEPPAGT